jgi:hypothetical protein
MPSETTRPQAETRIITVSGQRLRVAIRSGDGTRTPLLLMNGIGINLEVLQYFVDALVLAIKVIRFDGHLGLGTSARELAQVVDQFLTAPVSSSTGVI